MIGKVHAPHPTQHAACGAPSTVAVARDDVAFAAVPLFSRCRRCAKVLAAARARRAVYAGFDDGAGDTGARKVRP